MSLVKLLTIFTLLRQKHLCQCYGLLRTADLCPIVSLKNRASKIRGKDLDGLSVALCKAISSN
jgi:hypothetical protein